MDDRSMEKIISRREQGYIWLERELKKNIGISTALIAVFFLLGWMFLSGNTGSILIWGIMFGSAVVLNGVGCYLSYRGQYKNYKQIFLCLEEFESGNYVCDFENGLQEGIQPQILELMERMGQAFGTLKDNLIREKENTKKTVTDISHQLKTPVAALKLSFELLEDASLSTEEKQEFLSRGKQEAKKLDDLLDSLTNLSRMETGLIQLSGKETSLKSTIIRAVNGVISKAEEKKIEIEMEEFADIILFHDEKWTAEAFSNVLDNGVKYSPERSCITIRVKPQISYVLIEIADEGIGIPKTEYLKVFQRFYRGKNTVVQKQDGAGVGLYLVRKIIEEQGGSVRILPGQKKGSVIQIMLPKGRYEI